MVTRSNTDSRLAGLIHDLCELETVLLCEQIEDLFLELGRILLFTPDAALRRFIAADSD